MNHLMLFLAPPIRDIFLSSCAGGPISTQSCFGSNPTKKKKTWQLQAANKESTIWRIIWVIWVGKQCRLFWDIPQLFNPSRLKPAVFLLLSLLQHTLHFLFPPSLKPFFLPVIKQTIFDKAPFSQLALLSTALSRTHFQSEPAFTHSTHTNAVSSMTALFCQSEIAAVIFRLRWK